MAGVTEKYQVHRLIYYEQRDDIVAAIARKKQMVLGLSKAGE